MYVGRQSELDWTGLAEQRVRSSHLRSDRFTPDRSPPFEPRTGVQTFDTKLCKADRTMIIRDCNKTSCGLLRHGSMGGVSWYFPVA